MIKVRRGHQLRLVIPGPEALRPPAAVRDEKLVALLAEAHQARQLVLATPARSIAAIASEHRCCHTRLGKLVVLHCLAPDIVTAVLEGPQPAGLLARALSAADLPMAWTEQRTMFGFC